jgi:hypothetical protein
MSGAFSPSLVAIFVFWAAACIGLASSSVALLR